MIHTFPNIPHFDVVTRLGTGGMGRVYLARRTGAHGFEKLLAVKVIHPDKKNEADVRAMFLDEARLVAKLDHPTIAQVFDFGDQDGALYLVMEYVPGLSIDDVLSKSVSVPPLVCATIMASVLRGLHAAHDAKDLDGRPLNVVHRDVTPSNLVLTFGGHMKILDFGIALMRERSAPVTEVGQIRGKPTYISPEQLTGDALDRRTDIYAAFIILYELLTRQKLFTLDKHWRETAENITPPSEFGELPDGLEQTVMKGLSFAADDRFQSAKEAAQQLETILASSGCETLASFVDRAFEPDRLHHERRLQTLLGGAPAAEPKTPHPGTLEDVSPVQHSHLPTETVPRVAGRDRTKTASMDRPPPRRRAWTYAAIAALLVVGAWFARPTLNRTPPAEEIAAGTRIVPETEAPTKREAPPEPEAKPESAAKLEAETAANPEVAPEPEPKTRPEPEPAVEAERDTEAVASKVKRRRRRKRRGAKRKPKVAPAIPADGIIKEW